MEFSFVQELGLNMDTAISMFLTKCVNTASIPFKIEKNKINDELIEVIKEGDQILEDFKAEKEKTMIIFMKSLKHLMRR